MNDKLLSQTFDLMQDIKNVGSASSVLNWDMETHMPSGSAGARAKQLSTLSKVGHQLWTNSVTRELAHQLREAKFEGENQALIDLFLEDYDRVLKLPEAFVVELTEVATHSQVAWKEARKKKDFSIFQPHLEKVVELTRQQAELLGYAENKYDALLDIYEPGLTTAQLRPLFEQLRLGTMKILNRIEGRRMEVSNTILFNAYDTSKQLKFAEVVAKKIGFDFSHGRIDLSAHPFCTSFDRTDVRLTTRVNERDLRSCLFGVIHESGHGMYEQGIGSRYSGTLAGEGTSMGIHESQSLFWENVIARSEEFWTWGLPILKEHFPQQLTDISSLDFYKAINTISPSFIRVEADEVTYNLHIIIRFEIEHDLINGIMSVDDVPRVWSEKYQEYLGITPTHDSEGCLQDVHWAFAGIGYFPSYTLGKLYSAMFRNVILRELPDTPEQIKRGEFSNILKWLRDNIHDRGRLDKPRSIVQRVCGEPLSAGAFLQYAEDKVSKVYDVSFA